MLEAFDNISPFFYEFLYFIQKKLVLLYGDNHTIQHLSINEKRKLIISTFEFDKQNFGFYFEFVFDETIWFPEISNSYGNIIKLKFFDSRTESFRFHSIFIDLRMPLIKCCCQPVGYHFNIFDLGGMRP